MTGSCVGLPACLCWVPLYRHGPPCWKSRVLDSGDPQREKYVGLLVCGDSYCLRDGLAVADGNLRIRKDSRLNIFGVREATRSAMSDPAPFHGLALLSCAPRHWALLWRDLYPHTLGRHISLRGPSLVIVVISDE